jgi:methylenetetrahydrofolate reductase (NADPH)
LSGLVQALTTPRYEVYAARGVYAKVVEHVPTSVKVTVTSSERRGLDATLDLSEELANQGYEVVPHLGARLVLDRAHLKRILRRLDDAGVREAFVIAGDAKKPHGDYSDALSLLLAMHEVGHSLTDIGFVGYPEPHPFLSDEVLVQALEDKAGYATYIVTQICFEPRPIDDWVAARRRDGVSLPVYVGIPGAVDEKRLLRIAKRLGIPGAETFLTGHSGLYVPDLLIDGLRALDDPGADIGGFHVYTFNELEKTEAWRQAKREQLRAGGVREGTAVCAERR